MIALFLESLAVLAENFDAIMRAVHIAGVLLLTLSGWLAIARVLEAT